MSTEHPPQLNEFGRESSAAEIFRTQMKNQPLTEADLAHVQSGNITPEQGEQRMREYFEVFPTKQARQDAIDSTSRRAVGSGLLRRLISRS